MRHRDFIQNIAITLLAVSALFLFSRTQFFQLGAASVSNYWQRITAPASSAAAIHGSGSTRSSRASATQPQPDSSTSPKPRPPEDAPAEGRHRLTGVGPLPQRLHKLRQSLRRHLRIAGEKPVFQIILRNRQQHRKRKDQKNPIRKSSLFSPPGVVNSIGHRRPPPALWYADRTGTMRCKKAGSPFRTARLRFPI